METRWAEERRHIAQYEKLARSSKTQECCYKTGEEMVRKRAEEPQEYEEKQLELLLPKCSQLR